MYPMRQLNGVSRCAERTDVCGAEELSERERADFLVWDEGFTKKAREAYQIPVVVGEYYDAFLDGEKSDDVSEEKKRALRSRELFKERAAEVFLAQWRSGESFSLDDDVTHRRVAVLNQEQYREKEVALRTLRSELKEKERTAREGSDDMTADLVRLYRERINELIARMHIAATEGTSRDSARYDRFIFGVDGEGFDDDGMRRQITRQARTLADELAQRRSAMPSPEVAVTQKGLDVQILLHEKVSSDEVRRIAEDVLRKYGVLSAESPEEYREDRQGPAEDGGWQVIIKDVGGMSVNGIQKVVTLPRSGMPMSRVIAVAVAHEIEGHVVQNVNKEHLPLAFFREIRGARSEMYAEAGAMYNQNKVSQALFGYASLPHPHYLRAMEQRLEGGDYAQCVQAFFESIMDEMLPNERTEEDVAKAIKLATDRTLRLFRGQQGLSGGPLTNSKDLVYLEQYALMQQLERSDMTDYAFVMGMTAQSATILQKYGLLGGDIMRPQDHAQEVWAQYKDLYTRYES